MRSFLQQNSLLLDYPIIDQEHIDLMDLLADLTEQVLICRPDAAKEKMRQFMTRIRTHFTNEEHLMMQTGYKDLRFHKEVHEQFLANADRTAAGLEQKGIDGHLKQWLQSGFLEWFALHIVENDLHLVKHLHQHHGIR